MYKGQLFPSTTPLGLGEVTTIVVTTELIPPGEMAEFEVVTPLSYQLNRVTTSCPCWLRVYETGYARFYDTRTIPGPPFPAVGSGFAAEAVTVSGNLITNFSPPAEVQTEGIYTLFKVKNNTGIAQEIELKLEIVVGVYGIAPSSPPFECNTAVDTRNEVDLSQAWRNCNKITQLPLLNLSSTINLEAAWENCTRLQFVPPRLFDNCPATNLTNAFTNCSLSPDSVDNILVSLDVAGGIDGTVDLSGGSNSPPSVIGLVAKENLETKGWTVNTAAGGAVSFVDIEDEAYSLTAFGDGRVFVGSNSGNIYKSLNYGGTFDAGVAVGAGTIYSIAACEGNTVIAGTWADSFPWVSTDNGETWVAGTDFNQSEIDSVAHIGDGVVYIGTSGFIHKSEDNGVTWTEQTPVGGGDYYISLAFPGADKIVAGTYGDGYLVYSSNGGTSWLSTGTGALDGLSESMFGLASNGAGIVIASTDADGRVFRSLDSGANWDTGTQLGSATEVYCLTCSPTGVFYAGTNDDGKIYRSTNDGDTWEEFYDPGIPSGYVYSLINAGNGTLLAGIDTFVYSIPYSYLPANTGIPATQVYPSSEAPLFSSTSPGLTPSSGGGTTNFLRADGTWAAPPSPPPVGTDLNYVSSTRTLESSTGSDATLTLFSSSEDGLTPFSGGGTTNFLRADGTWNAPEGTASLETVNYTTSLLAPNAAEDFTLTGKKLFQFLSYTSSSLSWIRLYGTSAARAADSRTSPGGTPPNAGSEFYAELATTSSPQTIRLSPVPLVQPTNGDVFVRLVNTDSVSRAITIQLSTLSFNV